MFTTFTHSSKAFLKYSESIHTIVIFTNMVVVFLVISVVVNGCSIYKIYYGTIHE